MKIKEILKKFTIFNDIGKIYYKNLGEKRIKITTRVWETI